LGAKVQRCSKGVEGRGAEVLKMQRWRGADVQMCKFEEMKR